MVVLIQERGVKSLGLKLKMPLLDNLTFYLLARFFKVQYLFIDSLLFFFVSSIVTCTST